MRVGQQIEDSNGRKFELVDATTIAPDAQIIQILNGSTANVGDSVNIPLAPTGVVPKSLQRLGNMHFIRRS